MFPLSWRSDSIVCLLFGFCFKILCSSACLLAGGRVLPTWWCPSVLSSPCPSYPPALSSSSSRSGWARPSICSLSVESTRLSTGWPILLGTWWVTIVFMLLSHRTTSPTYCPPSQKHRLKVLTLREHLFTFFKLFKSMESYTPVVNICRAKNITFCMINKRLDLWPIKMVSH